MFAGSRAAAPAILAAVVSAGCASRDTGFDAVRARAHVEMLASTIGPRPIGSDANARARAYLVDRLQQIGLTVRIQETDAVDAARGATARVFNIIALREGASRDAVALVAHYDSAPEAPGALDDALGVTTCLEAARALSTSPMRHSLLVLLTDGEEAGLMGARAVVKDADVAARLRAFLNFDGTGAAGPSLLFETGPGLSAALEAWAGASAPVGASFGVEIYKRLPNDTDFTVLKATGAPGLNFAPVGDSYAYHTDRDVAARLQLDTIRHEGENTVSIVRRLDATDLTTRGERPTFFDLPIVGGVVYGETMTAVVAWTSVAAATIAWFVLTVMLWRWRRLPGVLLTPVWSLVTIGCTFGFMTLQPAVMRVATGVFVPWYSSPGRFVTLLVVSGAFALWFIAWLVAAAPERFRPQRTPTATWWIVLPIWTALTVLLQRTAPGASYMMAWPLLAASGAVILARRSPALMRFGSVLVFLVVWPLWLGKLTILCGFLVPLFGWLPAVMPFVVHPALVTVAGLVVAPPLLATLAGLRVSRVFVRRMSIALMVGLAVLIGLQYLSSPYTSDRPMRRAARYVQDDILHEAWWDVSSGEPAASLNGPGPAGADWKAVGNGPPASIAIARATWPFAERKPSAPLVTTPPATVRSMLSDSDGGRATFAVEILPSEPLAARVVLPQGVTPIDSSLTGVVQSGRWSATYIAVPRTGLTVRMTVARSALEALSHAVVVLTMPGLPVGEGPRRLPAWLPQETATWTARSIFVLPAGPAAADRKAGGL